MSPLDLLKLPVSLFLKLEMAGIVSPGGVPFPPGSGAEFDREGPWAFGLPTPRTAAAVGVLADGTGNEGFLLFESTGPI